MILVLVIFIVSGVIGWKRPVVGLGLFMLLQTPFGNVNAVSGHLLSEQGLFILATIRLLMRKPKRLDSWRLRGIEICALAFSLVVLLRQVEFMAEQFSLVAVGQVLCLVLVFGPLLVAFSRFDENDLANLSSWLCVAGLVVGVWGSLIYLTGNGYLMQLASWDRSNLLQTGVSSASAEAEQIVAGRFVVMGLFLVVPSAYWYVLRSALVQTRRHWLWNMGMWVGVATIVVAAGMSVTRGTILVIGLGTAVMLVTLALSGDKRLRLAPRTIVSAFLGACLLGVVLCLVDFTLITEMTLERFVALGPDDVNFAARINNTVNGWTYLTQSLCLFGAPGPNPFENCNGSVDMALPLHLWLWYGVPGVALFYAVFCLAFWRLAKSWLAPGLSREQKLLRSMLTAWSGYFVYSWIVGYCMSVTELFFTTLFVFETGRLKSKFLVTPNSKLRRAVA